MTRTSIVPGTVYFLVACERVFVGCNADATAVELSVRHHLECLCQIVPRVLDYAPSDTYGHHGVDTFTLTCIYAPRYI